jgi:hypothetical protein
MYTVFKNDQHFLSRKENFNAWHDFNVLLEISKENAWALTFEFLMANCTMIRNTKYLAWNYHFTFSIYNVLSLIKPSISNPIKGSYSNNNPVLWKQFVSPIDIKNTYRKKAVLFM